MHDDKNYSSPTLAVIRYSLMPAVPYAIFETREDGDGFGFMHRFPAFYDSFSETEMRKLVEVIYAFHKSGFTVTKDTLRYARNLSSKAHYYRKELEEWLDTFIMHKTQEGNESVKSVETFLISYLQLPDVRTKILDIFEKSFAYAYSSKSKNNFYLVHADMQIDNVYKHKNGDFELLDFEWVGKSDNPVIAIMYDYGNLRARAWSSPAFQKMLDKIMLEVGREQYSGSEEVIQAALVLGTLRSSLMMSRYHLDVVNTVKKDKRTEDDYHSMYPQTLAL